jgi:hypothetical protein
MAKIKSVVENTEAEVVAEIKDEKKPVKVEADQPDPNRAQSWFLKDAEQE